MIYFYRVIGAIVIVAGLYLVVWGKSKDYKSSSKSIIDEKIEEAEQMKDECQKGNENSSHKVTINASKE